MPKGQRGYFNHRSGLGDAYCEAIEALRDHCEKTGQSYMRVMIDIIEAKLMDDRCGKDAEGSEL